MRGDDRPGLSARIASSVDASNAVLCEPLVTVLHALSATRLEPGERIGVIGAGTIGLLAVQVASAMGMSGEDTVPVDAVALLTKGPHVTRVLGGILFLARAVQLIEKGAVQAGPLIHRVLPWNENGSALELRINRGATRPKLILDFSGRRGPATTASTNHERKNWLT